MTRLNETGVAGALLVDLIILLLVVALVIVQPATGVSFAAGGAP